jgi:putative nucleotidyltransferase with HDIG domain
MPLAVYVRLVSVAGAAAVAYSLVGLLHAPHPIEWMVFAVLAILAGAFTLNIASIEASISIADTFFISSALLFGPAPATIAVAVDSLLQSSRKRYDWSRIAFNTAAPALSLWVAAQAFFLVSGTGPLSVTDAPLGRLTAPLLGLAAVYFILNSGLIAVAVALHNRQSAFQIWREHFLWLGLGYFAAASVAMCVILIIRQVGLGAVAMVLPVLAVFHHTLRSSFGRVDDARRHVSEIDRLYKSTVETLAMAIDAKDAVTHSHVRRVQAYARALAHALGVADQPTLKAIEAAALLHDTGKLAVPERILNKPGGLTPAEFEEMKRHVDVGADILSLVDFPYPVVPIVRCHHENWDGTGYPRGVAGESIPIGARILSVVDCFDALTSDRPYRRALTDAAALDILRERRGRMYDPLVVDTFIAIYRDVPIDDSDTPERQEVMQQINRSSEREMPPAVVSPSPADAARTSAAAGDDVLAFVSLSRLASGTISVGDVLALTTNLVCNIVPEASGAWFLLNEAGDKVEASSAFGPFAASVNGLTIRVGDRLTGWVASNRQVIVNSDAALDLCGREPNLQSCLSAPLLSGETLVGVLSFYAEKREGFTADQGRLVEMIAPHIAQALQTARERERAEPRPAAQARDLKLVASR